MLIALQLKDNYASLVYLCIDNEFLDKLKLCKSTNMT